MRIIKMKQIPDVYEKYELIQYTYDDYFINNINSLKCIGLFYLILL